jgi:hypothetical protein
MKRHPTLRKLATLLTLLILNFCGLTIAASTAHATSTEDSYVGIPEWKPFQKYMEVRQEDDRVLGASYLISGTVATLGGMLGYYASEDPFSRGVYAVAQSVGVAAIGYGASEYWIGNEYNSFYHAVDGSSLTMAQKGELLQRFLERDQEVRQRTRWIKVITHSLVAAVNLYNSTHESDKNVRGVLQFLGGTNAIIATSYAF